MTRAAWVALAIAGLAISGLAQARPDFSGRWTSEPAESPAGGGRRGGGGPARSGDMGSGWGSSITIAQNARQLTVEYAFFTRGDLQPPLTFTYALDGSTTRNHVTMGRGLQESVSTAAWQGETLVITTTAVFAHPATGERVESTETRTLSLEAADALVVEVTRAGVLGGPSSTTRTRFRLAS